jgi:hypothetical protein
MRCAGTSSGSGTDDRAGATWAELEGGPGEHRRRPGLVDQRTAWQQRVHAVLFHHGLPCPDHALLTQATRSWLEQLALPQASRL